MLISNMTSKKSNKGIANQFIINKDNGIYFQSYESMIVFIPYHYDKNISVENRYPHQKIHLDSYYYNYSKTTIRYRNQFLNETSEEIENKIKTKEYILCNLN